MAKKYIKVDVRDAVQWTGDNAEEIQDFIPALQTPQHNVDAKTWIFFFHGSIQILKLGDFVLLSKSGQVLRVSEVVLLELYSPIDSHLIQIKTGVAQAINDVVAVEGEIEKVYTIGNSLSILFKNGNRYSQPLITKNTNLIHENP